jgi:hypothetical protein
MKIKRVLLTALPIVVGIIVTLIMTACSGSSGSKLSGPNNETTTIAGKVLNAQQVPMPFAEIELYKSDNAHKVALADKTMLAKTSGALRASGLGNDFTTRANEAGEFAFSDIPAGEYTLRAQLGDGQQFLKTRLNTNTAKEGMITLNVTLTPTGGASGVVTYLSDPVKNAVMYLDGTQYVAITDAEGKYSFTNVPVSDEPYLVKMLEIPMGKHGEYLLYNNNEPSIEIEKGGNLSISTISLYQKENRYYDYYVEGRLTTDGSFSAVKNRIIIAINSSNLTDPYAEIYYTTTDNDGSYSLRLEKTGIHFITVIKTDDEIVDPNAVTAGVGIGHTSDNPLQCDDMKIIRGILVTGTLKYADNTPAANEVLRFLNTSNEPVSSTVTDANGNFSISTLPMGNYRIKSNNLDISCNGDYNYLFKVAHDNVELTLIAKSKLRTITAKLQNASNVHLDTMLRFYTDPNTQESQLFYYANLSGDTYTTTLPMGAYYYSIYDANGYLLTDDTSKGISNGSGSIIITTDDVDLGILKVEVPLHRVSLSGRALQGFEAAGDRYYLVESNADQVFVTVGYAQSPYRKEEIINSDTSLTGLQDVSSAIYNGHLFVMTRYAEPQGVHIYKFESDLFSRTDYNNVCTFKDKACSLFATDAALYLIGQNPNEPSASWLKIPFNDPTFNAGNDLYHNDLSPNAGFTHIMPCHNETYIYIPWVTYEVTDPGIAATGIQINAYNKLIPLDQQSPIPLANLPIPDGVTLGNASIHLSCENNSIFITMHLSESQNYIALLTHMTHEIPGDPINLTWNEFSLDSLTQRFANDYTPYNLNSLKAKTGYNHLGYPLLAYGGKTILVNPIRQTNDAIYVLGATGSGYEINVLNKSNWPE